MFSTILKNSFIGDGTINEYKSTCSTSFMAKDIEYVVYKESLFLKEIAEYTSIKHKKSYSGYRDDYSINRVEINGIPKKSLGWDTELTYESVIEQLDEFDLFLWYLDDGSWHIRRNTMHLYCNMLNEKQTNLLCDKIESIHGIRPTIRIDRKKDGRQFYYLYYPRKLVNVLHPIYRQYLIDANLECMYYKVGGLDYVDKKSA